MQPIRYIDADSHIEEGPGVWDHLEGEYLDRKPQIIDVAYAGAHKHRDKAWLIDGKLRPHNMGRGPTNYSSPSIMTWAKMKPIPVESQMMAPPQARLRDMDRLDIAVQVNYPTIFLEHLSEDRGLEAALMRAWNRFMAAATSEAPERLKWAALVPFWDAAAARREMEWAKENGAVGIYTLGTVYDTLLNDRRFDPIYEICEALDMPVCVHIGWAHSELNRSCDSMLASVLFTFEHSVLHAFYAFLGGGLLDRFRNLRVAFLEGPIEAYVYLLERMAHYREMATTQTPLGKLPPHEYLKQGRVYFSTEGDEAELPKILGLVGEDHVMLTADFPHVHFEENQLCTGMNVLMRHKGLSPAQKTKICVENAIAFYKMDVPADLLQAKPVAAE